MRNHYIKMVCIYFLSFFLILFIFFISTISIPKKSIEKNTVDSIVYLNNDYIYKRTQDLYPKFLKSDDGDLRYMEMEYLLNEKKPVKSIVEMNSYLNGYTSKLLDPKYKDYTYNQYARYWHGPVFFIRPLLMFLNIHNIYIINLIILLGISLLLAIGMFKKNKCLFIAFIISFFMFSLQSTFNCISYFNCLIISFIASLIILKKYDSPNKKQINTYLFMITGLLTSVLDFYTLESLTFLLPLLIYTILNIEKNKSVPIKEIILYILIWFISYLFPFVLKWIIDYIYLGKDIIIDIFNRGITESYSISEGLRIPIILYNNFTLILPFYFINNIYLLYLLLILIVIDFVIFVDLKKYKSVFLLLLFCFLRLFIVSVQAINLPFTTFRTLLPIIFFVLYVIIKQISLLKQNN